MAKNVNQELRALSLEQLHDKLDDFRRELFQLKLNAATSHIKDGSQFKKLKKDIARTLTAINERYRTQIEVTK